MTSKPISILAALLMAASGGMVQPAQAQEDQTPLPPPTFGEVDIDNNGFISTGESVAVPGLLEEMSRLDKDRRQDRHLGVCGLPAPASQCERL